jgi:hypothetical protein
MPVSKLNAPPKKKEAAMSAEALPTSDVIGLTKVAPLSRRGFMTASAAVTAGYTLAATPAVLPRATPKSR